MNVYLIGGLGADERIFQRLDLSPHQVHIIHWITPLNGESIKTYAGRLASQIDRSTDFALLGVSFGGMIAAELHEMLNSKLLIVVSSTKSFRELPKLYQWAGKLKLHKLIPHQLLKTSALNPFLFGCKTPEAKKLLQSILKDTDTHFLKWAIDAILTWERHNYAKETIHIHGDKDYILKAKNVVDSRLIKGAGHFMIFEQAEELSKRIKTYLEE